MLKKSVAIFGFLAITSALVSYTLHSSAAVNASNLTLKTSITSTIHPGYDGKTLFEGMFFADGPASSLLPAIVPSSGRAIAPQPAHLRNAAFIERERRTIFSIEKSDPTFFSFFETEMKSGDPVRVEASLQKGASILERISDEHQWNTSTAGTIPLNISQPQCSDPILPQCAIVYQSELGPDISEGVLSLLARPTMLRDTVIDRIAHILS